jgi:L-threonylcarbamoyladenylate synthase
MKKELADAKFFLEKGELVAIPTETVYGLAGNAYNRDAVLKIFSTKNRPVFDPLIVHCADTDRLRACAAEFPDWARTLTDLMPASLTILLKKKAIISDLLTAGSEKVALRIPAHQLTLELLSVLDFPLAAPSANPFGYISPTTAEHVRAQLGDKIPLILNGGACSIGLESTIVGEDNGKITIFRKGGFPTEKLQEIFGEIQVAETSNSNPKAPGMLSSHYAPRVPFFIGRPRDFFVEYGKNQTAFLAFAEKSPDLPDYQQLILSPSGDLNEAARNLFDYMRKLDNAGYAVIVAEFVPEIGLGRAVNDRLRRASFR